jgi:hypothetical protein
MPHLTTRLLQLLTVKETRLAGQQRAAQDLEAQERAPLSRRRSRLKKRVKMPLIYMASKVWT